MRVHHLATSRFSSSRLTILAECVGTIFIVVTVILAVVAVGVLLLLEERKRSKGRERKG